MKFKLARKVLAALMAEVAAIIEGKTTIPALGFAKLVANKANNTLTVTTTDLDVTVESVVEAEVEADGEICLPGKKLTDIVRALPDGDVNFDLGNNERMAVKAGKARFVIAGATGEGFPETPKFTALEKGIKFASSVIVQLLDAVKNGITTEQSRFTLDGAKIEIGKGIVRAIATDGHRLFLAEVAIADKDVTMDVLIPKKAIGEMIKLANQSNEITIAEDANHIFMASGDYRMVARKLSGTFPNYEMVIPNLSDYREVVFQTAALKEIAARIALMSDQRTRSLKLSVRQNEIEVSAISAEEGEGNEVLDVTYKGDAIEVGFNGDYLRDYLSVADSLQSKLGVTSKTSTLYLKDANAQILLVPNTEVDGKAGVSLRSVIMPLRL